MKYLERIIKDYFDEALGRFVDNVRTLEQGKKPPLSIQQLAVGSGQTHHKLISFSRY